MSDPTNHEPSENDPSDDAPTRHDLNRDDLTNDDPSVGNTAHPQADQSSELSDGGTQAAGQNTQAFGATQSVASKSERDYIGPYKTLRKIGEGGMGFVFLAEQEHPIRRQVAVKVIKHEVGSEQIIARFEAERQALAMMDHPNIAKVLDAGTAQDGAPYFAMELVNGVPFTEFCDKQQFSIRKRLELFLPVCEAVQHAHQKGIIHRDLKPSNVLVAEYDGKAVPKVIDFGLAKALDHQIKLSDKSMFTEFGAVVGTLQYMSPEQAGMEAQDIDTRTDIYSLGVMLYEILTGSPPLNKESMKEKVLLTVLQMIREQDPPRPSTRLSDSGATIASISGHRMIEPQRLQQILRGELDWIVMKSIEKQRARRYETANAFARDIRRFLDDEPIEARPPSLTYRFSKTLKRHRGIALATACIFLVLIASLAIITRFYFNEKRLAKENSIIAASNLSLANEKSQLADERDLEARKAWEEADNQRATTEFLFDVFGAGDPIFSNITSRFGEVIGRKTTVQQMAKRAADAELDDDRSSFSGRPLLRARILQGIADVCITSGELQLAKESLVKCEAILQAEQPSSADIGKVLASLGLLDYMFGDLEQGLQRLVESQRILTAELESDPGDRGMLRKLQDSRLILGTLLIEFDRHDDAIQQFKLLASIAPDATPEAKVQILAGKMFALTAEVDRRQIHGESLFTVIPRLAAVLSQFMNEGGLKGLVNESIAKTLQHGIRVQLSSIPRPTESGYNELKAMHASIRDTLGEDHVVNCFPLFYLAVYAEQLSKKTESLTYIDALLQLVDEVFGQRKHPRLCQVLNLRGKLMYHLAMTDRDKHIGDLPTAENSLTESLAIGVPFFPEDHTRLAEAYMLRGHVRFSLSKFAEAADDYAKWLESKQRKYGTRHLKTQSARMSLARAFEFQGKLDDAIQVQTEVVEIAKSAPDASRIDQGTAQVDLVRLRLTQSADVPEAEERLQLRTALQEAIEHLSSDGGSHPKIAIAKQLLEKLEE